MSRDRFAERAPSDVPRHLRMKLQVLIPVHAPATVAKLTIGSFLRHHSEHDVTIHVGVHSNWRDYTDDTSLFDDLDGIAQIHMVDEIDWALHGQCWYRYSTMHAKNLSNLLMHSSHYTYDRVVLLDQDVFVKAPFVTEYVGLHPDADLISALMDDTTGITEFKTEGGEAYQLLPKATVWHAILSERLVRQLLATDRSSVFPNIVAGDLAQSYCADHGIASTAPLFIDTFAAVLHNVKYRWRLKHVPIMQSEFARTVEHFYKTSFNYGQVSLRSEEYRARIERISAIYAREFPDGLKWLA